MVAMFVMPRLPTPMATRAPGRKRAANGEPVSSRETAEGMSRILRSGNFWCTSKRRENSMHELYQADLNTRPALSYSPHCFSSMREYSPDAYSSKRKLAAVISVNGSKRCVQVKR